MSKNCPIMKRMKENYENRNKYFLTRRTPVIMRVDGKAFHTYTRGLERPFDDGLIEDMDATAIYLCEQIQGAKCAYVQSDEINILITDYDKIGTDAWADYNVAKMVSHSAGWAAGKFNLLRTMREFRNTMGDLKIGNLANFDSRVFNVPKEEVPNYFIARQRDAVKNSVASVAQSLYSHKELHGKNQSEMQEMIFQKGTNWNDYHYGKKRGRWIVKNTYVNDILAKVVKSDPNAAFRVFPMLVDGEVAIDLLDNKCFEYGVGIHEGGSAYGGNFEIENPVIRSKWETVETPMSFNESHFKKWL